MSEKDIEETRKTQTAQLFAANYELEFISAEDVIFSDPKYEPWWYTNIDTIRAQVDIRDVS